MVQRISMGDDEDFSLQIKTLDNEELLDVWVQTQQIEESLRREYHGMFEAPNYEWMIVNELQLRSSSSANGALS